MSQHYDRPAVRPDALRLHLNENTAGCSRAVLDALGKLTCHDVGFYPAYDDAIADCAAYVGVDPARVTLTNGLDEGLLATIATAFRHGDPRPTPPEAIVALPTFDMYGIYVQALGGRLVGIPPAPDFAFPLEELLGAMTPATRVILLANPNNPTGLGIAPQAIDRIVAETPRDVFILIDEAYYEFSGDTYLAKAVDHPNVIIGRTFAKAFGLAGLRVGCLIADPETAAPIRAVIPPYSVNAFAAAALGAALADPDFLPWYQDQVAESKRRLYAACDRFGFKYWPSRGNFVLAQSGPRTRELVKALDDRGILIRDRSYDAGPEGYVRIAAGVVAHTQRCIDAMEEVLCGAPR